MSAIPKIHEVEYHKGYILSPFNMLPTNIDEAIEKIKTHANTKVVPAEGPLENGYCELCSRRFDSARKHRNSQSHMLNTNSSIWDEFDTMADEVTREMWIPAE